MSVQPLRKEGDQKPRTAEEAKALVKQVESLFMPWNIDALVAGFTDDCIVRFGTVPEFRGRDALRAFFTARSGKQDHVGVCVPRERLGIAVAMVVGKPPSVASRSWACALGRDAVIDWAGEGLIPRHTSTNPRS